ncbi:U3 snoRNP protein, partial [Perkinsus olseni]
WTIPESAVDTELLSQFGDSNKHSATDSYVPEGAIPRLTAACYSPFAGEHPEVASASVRATVAVLSCAQRDQSSRTEIVSDEEAEDEEDVNEEVDDTDVEETDEDVEPSTESAAAADVGGKASSAAADEEEDVSDTEDAGEGVADMGLLAEDEHHNDENGGDGDLVVELPPESSARVPPRLRWLLVRTSYETRKLLAAYKRSGGIVRLGALLKLVCASAVL